MRGLRWKAFRRSEGVEQRDVDNEVFLVAPESGSIHHLDPLGAAIWRLYAEPKTLAQIESVLIAAFPDAAPEAVKRDLKKLFDALRDYDLICESNPPTD